MCGELIRRGKGRGKRRVKRMRSGRLQWLRVRRGRSSRRSRGSLRRADSRRRRCCRRCICHCCAPVLFILCCPMLECGGLAAHPILQLVQVSQLQPAAHRDKRTQQTNHQRQATEREHRRARALQCSEARRVLCVPDSTRFMRLPVICATNLNTFLSSSSASSTLLRAAACSTC